MKLKSALIGVVSLLSFNAHAGFVDLRSGDSYPGGKAQSAAPATEAGSATAVSGMGRDVPLKDAVDQILKTQGKDYKTVIPPGFEDKLVSWQGGDEWPVVLDKAVRTIGLRTEIDWAKRQVLLSQLPPEKESKPAAPAPKFQVKREDGYIAKSLDRWTKQAGWQLVWDAGMDLVVEADAEFSGSFEEAVSSLFSGLSEFRIPLKATLYGGNRVLRVTKMEGTTK